MIGNTGADTADYSGRSAAVAVSLDGVANDGDIATNEGDNVGGFSVSCRPQTIIVNPPLSIVSTSPTGSTFVVSGTTVFLDAPVAGPAPNCVILPTAGVTTTPTTVTTLPIIGLKRAPQGFLPPSGFFTCDQGETLGGDQSPLANPDVENVNGGSADDQLVGSAVGNVLNGNAGNDRISGGASADQLNGGGGDDSLAGGEGNDAIDGGEGTNWADYAQAANAVQVNLTTGTASGEGNDALKNIQNVQGTSFADSISGNDQANVLNGNGGSDALAGNAGDDTVNGGAGADQMSGQSGTDKVTGGEGDDAGQGGAGDDWMQGGQGKDTLLGQQGNDSLYGNAQPDFLNGGRGQNLCKPGSPGLARGDVVVNCG
jgi:Ca2+-binding RTX toxin-like protein